ncbi:S8 family serine peptidase [Shimia sagamensis]|uniref:Subtilase family protein n=1 Tax=Shimia sagamensis TaxID=1566352 RepID=A0ABY1P616_9RHOB|nr:S8 family serine peptidase [Shimia sagamensis]SMP24910.1 Subtilase family protein [Shimia sagamensis]
MTYTWTDLPPRQQPRDPLAYFALNPMQRFFEADRDFANETPADTDPVDYEDQMWLALISVAKRDDNDRSWSLNDLQNKAANYDPPLPAGSLIIPGEYRHSFRERTDLDVVSIYAKRAYLNAANAADGEHRLGIESITTCAPLDRRSLHPSSEPFLPPAVTQSISSEAVVTAVIDHGIAIAHDLFRREEDGNLVLSRVDFFLNMDDVSQTAGQLPASLGRVWTRSEIETVLKKHLHNGLLDEAEVYRELGLINWQDRPFNSCAHRVSHGTHVAGLAAGYDAGEPVGEDRRIIAIQLPTSVVRNTMGYGIETTIEKALGFVAEHIQNYVQDGEPVTPPLVINFSFGNFLGPHDGTGVVSRAIHTALAEMSLSTNQPRLLLLPSGNGNLSRCHAVIELTEQAPEKEIDWVLQPSDRSASVLSIWLPLMPVVPDAALTVSITLPGENEALIITVGMVPQFTLINRTSPDGGEVVIGIVVYYPPKTPTFRGQIMIVALPTDNPKDVRPVAPFGNWALRFVKSEGVGSLKLNAWVQRDETLPGFPEFGRQSRLSDQNYPRFKAPGGKVLDEDPPSGVSLVRRAGMINGIGCGTLPAVIAGYVDSDGKMAAYSAGGPTLNVSRLFGPDASAVSDDSVALHGVLSAGSSSGSRVSMNGTSVSTPQVARWAAGKMAASPNLPFGRADVFAQALADDPYQPDKPAPSRTGGGRLRLPSVFGGLR